MGTVKCSVEECQYYNQMECHAPLIHVNYNGVNHSSQSQETQCDTFKPRQ
ncbi:MAG: DUF1540 domain-containing protein [Desulfitobacteriia bacterium]|jgi:hypothetical protein